MKTIHALLATLAAAAGSAAAGSALQPASQAESSRPIEPQGAEQVRSGLVIGVSELRFTGDAPSLTASYWLRSSLGPALLPRVVIDGHAAVLGTDEVRGGTLGGIAGAVVAVDAESVADDLTGTLFLPTRDARSMVAHPFVAPKTALRRNPALYRDAHARHYRSLRDAGLPGAAWFRRRAEAFGAPPADLAQAWTRRGASSDQDAFAMFTGGRAVAENLRLDEVIRESSVDGIELVPIETIEGVRVPEMQWGDLVDGLDPEVDPLSAAIPADQHAVFFPSFDALVRVADQLADDSAPLVHLADGRAEDSLVRTRYETQLCLGLDALTRRFGGQFVQSVAITGSDPYLRTGSDVALLFEGDVPSIVAYVRSRMEVADADDIEEVDVVGARAVHVFTPDRRVDAWLVARRDFVIVTNSRAQLERLLSAERGDLPSLDELPETRFFRDRYVRGDEAEDALVVVSDAAIRRWAGPRWRIASARRTRMAALLADADAWAIAGELGVERAPDPYGTDAPVAGRAHLPRFSDGSAHDPVHGTRRFLTPIAELVVDKVTPSERDGYVSWRTGYERAWGAAFDPLAIRLSAKSEGLEADLSILPLTVRSRYRWMIDLAGQALLAPDAGDGHEGTVMHWVSAIDHDGPTYREIASVLRSFGQSDDLGIDWVGDHVAVWLDHDAEYFERVREADSFDMFTEEMLPGLPFGVYLDVDSALGLAGFLTGLRVMAEQATPGLLDFATREYGGRQYVAIEIQEGAGFEETPTIHYAVLPGALCLSFSSRVIEGAIDRANARAAGDEVAGAEPWIGRSTALRIGGAFRDAAASEMVDLAVRDRLRARSWSNLAILNEWRRLGARDPLAVYEARWGARLVCPGGGEYVWNDAAGTMESTVYGHPATPKDGPLLPPAIEALRQLDFGLEFESLEITPPEQREGERRRRDAAAAQGLRARFRLSR
ncbi:MAG: hypothetical protein AAF957_13645 [Planctomycetota bacterium]